MPLVDFHCSNCGKNKEVLVKDPNGDFRCECGILMTRQVGKSNFSLQGTGWFKDGYAKSN